MNHVISKTSTIINVVGFCKLKAELLAQEQLSLVLFDLQQGCNRSRPLGLASIQSASKQLYI